MLKELREQLKNERSVMDELRKELEQFKNEKNYLWRERAEALYNLKELSRRVVEDEERLKKKLEQLEWYHQTTPLSAKEEDEIIKKIIEIEKKLLIYNKMTQMKRKSAETDEKLNEIIKKREEIISKLEQTRQKINNLRSAIDEIMKEMHQNGIIIEETMKRIIESAQKAEELKSKYFELSNKIKEERAFRRSDSEHEKHQKLEKIENELFERALEKFKKGMKLDFYEYYILVKRGVLSQETSQESVQE